jgi:hypothetical protein
LKKSITTVISIGAQSQESVEFLSGTGSVWFTFTLGVAPIFGGGLQPGSYGCHVSSLAGLITTNVAGRLR